MTTAAGILATDLAGISLRNPVLLAAGTCGTLDEMSDVLDLSRIGGVVSKSITPQPREGNPTWRILPARAGMLNAIGLANPGIDAFESHYLPRAAALPCTVICSVAGFCVEDYVQVAAVMDEWHDKGVTAIELNISCPNVKAGTEFGSSPALTREVVTAVRAVAKRCKLLAKLSPTAPELPLIARAAIDTGIDGLTISNTIPAMAIDVHTRRPRLANTTGGLSGPALHPVAVRLVHEIYRKVCKDTGTPIIGVGGVTRWEDAAEFILAGATAVQIGAALFADPRAPLAIVRGLEKWVRGQGCATIQELVGALRLD
jgi:dihydroorotate dehydrogenase (NAD+) catalytic subunit